MQSLTTSYLGTPFTLSAQQITDTVNATAGVNRWTPRYRLLDRTLKAVPLGTAGVTGDTADLTQFGAVFSCAIDLQTARPVHRTADIGWKEIPQFTFNPLRHRVQVLVDYWDASGNLLFEVPVGIFAHIIPDRTIAPTGTTWSGTWLDETHIVARKKFLNQYDIAQGSNYVTAVQNLLTMDYLPKSRGGTGATPAGLDDSGPAIPQSRIVIPPTTLTTPTTLSYGRKDSKLQAINDLLAAISYYPLWVDAVGTFRSSPKPYYTTTKPTLGWTYTTADSSCTIEPRSVQQRFGNGATVANVMVMESTNNGSAAFYSVKYNTGDSIISIPNLGDTIMDYLQDDKAPSQAALDTRCLLELQARAMALEEVSFNSFVNPFTEVHDQYSLTITDVNGVPAISTAGTYYFEETAWRMDLDRRTMSHTVSRQIGV